MAKIIHPRAVVTEDGLARRLGDRVFLVRKRSEEEGRLVYYPNRFAVLKADETLIPVREGDIIKLWVGSIRPRPNPQYRAHVYSRYNNIDLSR